MTSIKFVLLTFLLAFSLQASTKEWSLYQGSVGWKRLLLPTETFETSLIEKQFRDLLDKKKSDVTVLQVEAIDRLASASLSESGYNDISYRVWKSLYDDYQSRIPPFAEMLVIGDAVGMRLRDNQGRVSLKVFGDKNPYDLTACGEVLAVAHVSIRQVPEIADAARQRITLHFFLTTKHTPNERIAACALDELRRKISALDIEVNLRADSWFLQHSDYPIVSPFLADATPPTQDQYESGVEWECALRNAESTCAGGRRRFQFGPGMENSGLPESAGKARPR